jgi:hypothetical protein
VVSLVEPILRTPANLANNLGEYVLLGNPLSANPAADGVSVTESGALSFGSRFYRLRNTRP